MSRSVPTSGLIQRKIHAITARVAEIDSLQTPFLELTGEREYEAMPTSLRLKGTPLLEIERRKKASPEAIWRLTELRLARAA